MKLNNLINNLEQDYPLSLQELWDCSGLLYNGNKDIKKILITLDITTKVEQFALANNIDLIISHHPLIFSSYLNSYSYIRNTYHNLKAEKISLYSMHTNYDNHPLGMNHFFLNNMNYLNRIIEQKDHLITFSVDDNILIDLNNTFNINAVVYNQNNTITKACVVLGSGGSFIEEAHQLGCNCLISSEFKHHNILYALEHDIVLIDVSHQLEYIFVKNMYQYFNSRYLNELEVFTMLDLYQITSY